MKELVVISGKGGTGKTSVVGAMAYFARNKVLADCDVDASNLPLLFSSRLEEKRPFYGSQLPVMDKELCIQCGRCASLCPAGAIQGEEINPLFCEGCLICYHACNEKAITVRDRLTGSLYRSQTGYGPLIHASLGIAEENSGKLVAEVKRAARELAKEVQASYLILDGPPGCACPLLAAISGVDLALIVTEPSVSGLHDLERILQVLDHFQIPATICINKMNLNEIWSRRIQDFCLEKGLDPPDGVRFHPFMTRALCQGEVLPSAYPNSSIAMDLLILWERLQEKLIRR